MLNLITNLFSEINPILAVFIVTMTLLSAFMGGYALISFLNNFGKYKTPTLPDNPRTRFKVLIPAHNERRVIADCIKSVFESDYPRDMMDVIVLANNCSDDTAEVARQAGAKVVEVEDSRINSKASALSWYFRNSDLMTHKDETLFMVDADNIIDKNALRYLDVSLSKGYKVVQSRCLALNRNASAATGIMAIFFAAENRIWNLPHSNRGQTTLMKGTGCAIKISHLADIGWKVESLSDDVEFSLRTILSGNTIHYNDKATVYAEFATEPETLWKQLRRWYSGQWDVMGRYFPKLVKRMLHDFNSNLMVPFVLLLMPILTVMSIIKLMFIPMINEMIFGNTSTHIAVLSVLSFITVSYSGTVAFSIFVLKLDGQSLNGIWKGILLTPFYGIFAGLNCVYSLINPKKSWEPIKHGLRRGRIKKKSRATNR
ncbi:MAG: glycosyltransferase family 2 protein [Ruminococcaceae bacterium]|nr:glycosyltransferase family 2 protein [Oscillospiraceae bacterium]